MDGASEGQATDGRSGRGLRQKDRRAEQVSAQQPRAVRQNHGMAVVARRQVVTGPPGRSDSSDLVPWHGALILSGTTSALGVYYRGNRIGSDRPGSALEIIDPQVAAAVSTAGKRLGAVRSPALLAAAPAPRAATRQRRQAAS